MTYHKSYILLSGIIISLVVVAGTIAVFNMPGFIRALLAFPFVFFLPGFALVTVIAPRYKFRLPEQMVLSLGLSIMISIFGSFLLNLTPSGLTNKNWAITLGGWTVISCILALIRLRVSRADHGIQLNVALSLRQMIFLGLSVAMVITAWLIAYSGAEQVRTSTFTQLWMLPDSHQANIVTIGIRNMESNPMHFKLIIRGDQGEYFTWDSIQVDRGKTWEAQYTLPIDIPSQKIEAWLYRLEPADTEPYRKVSYWYPSLSSLTPATSTPP